MVILLSRVVGYLYFRRIPLCLLLLFGLSYPLCAQDSIQCGIRERESLRARLSESHFDENPAALDLQYRYNLSSFGLKLAHRHDSGIRFAEQGSGHTLYQAVAESYIRIDSINVVSGFADYTRGIKRAVSWNSVADFFRLYPYIVADTKGGDLKHEQYRFGGSYARLLGRYSVGAGMTYRALQDHREQDPRPRNITSDFCFTLGAGIRLPEIRYQVSTSLFYNVYKQLSGVDIYSERGGPVQLLMDGPGSSFRRFDTTEPSLYYRSHRMGGALSLLPLSGTGFSAKASYHYTSLQRILSGKNETPINHYVQHHLAGQVGFLSHDQRWGVRGDAGHTLRVGYDHIIGDPFGGSYPILTHRRNSIVALTHAGLSGGAEFGRAVSCLLLPTIRYDRLLISHAAPHQELGIHRLAYSLPVILRYKGWQADLQAQYSHTPARRINIKRGELLPLLAGHLDQVYRSLSDSFVTLSANPSYTLSLGKETALRIYAGYSYRRYGSGLQSHGISTTVTLLF